MSGDTLSLMVAFVAGYVPLSPVHYNSILTSSTVGCFCLWALHLQLQLLLHETTNHLRVCPDPALVARIHREQNRVCAPPPFPSARVSLLNVNTAHQRKHYRCVFGKRRFLKKQDRRRWGRADRL